MNLIACFPGKYIQGCGHNFSYCKKVSTGKLLSTAPVVTNSCLKPINMDDYLGLVLFYKLNN